MRIPTSPVGSEPDHDDGLWRAPRRVGPVLIFERGAVLPKRCLLCNAPGVEEPIRQSIVTSAAKPKGLIGVAIYFATRRSTHVSYYLCETHFRERQKHQRRLKLAGAVLLLVGMSLVSIGLFWAKPANSDALLLSGGVASFFGFVLPFLSPSSPLKGRLIDDENGSAFGAGSAFLDSIHPE